MLNGLRLSVVAGAYAATIFVSAAAVALIFGVAAPALAQGQDRAPDYRRDVDGAPVDPFYAKDAEGWSDARRADLRRELRRADRALQTVDLSEAASALAAARDVIGDLAAAHPIQALAARTEGRIAMARGDAEHAEALFRIADEYLTDALGEDHPETARARNRLGEALFAQQRYDEAAPVFDAARLSLVRSLGPTHPELGDVLANMGLNADYEGRFEAATEFHERALSLRRARLGPNHLLTAAALSNLGQNMVYRGRHEEAATYLQDALKMQEQAGALTRPETLQTRNGLAVSYYMQGRYDGALTQFEALHAARAALLGAEHLETIKALNNVAATRSALGRYQEARDAFEMIYGYYRRTLGDAHRLTSVAANNLARTLDRLGRRREAEGFFRVALEVLERALGADHPNQALALERLAENLASQGRAAEAEPLLRRAVAIDEEHLEPDHPYAAQRLRVLAQVLSRLGRADDAETLFLEAITRLTRSNGSEFPATLEVEIDLARHWADEGDLRAADDRIDDVLARLEAVYGPRHPNVAEALGVLGAVRSARGFDDDAEDAFRRARGIWADAVGSRHPDAAQAMQDLAALLIKRGAPADALDAARPAFKARRALGRREGADTASDARLRLDAATGGAAWAVTRAAYDQAHALEPTAQTSLFAEAFEAAQAIFASSTAEALTRAAARSAAGETALADLARRWEAALEERAAVDRLFAEAAGRTDEAGRNARDGFAQRRGQLDVEIEVYEQRLREAFPAFFDLARPESIDLTSLRDGSSDEEPLLRPDEALILFSEGRRYAGRDYPGVVFAVTRDAFAWAEVGLGPRAMSEAVRGIRESVVASGGATRTDTVETSAGRSFDRAAARRLHDALFGDPRIRSVIQSKSNWILAPQGALLSLPFAALVTGSFEGADDSPVALRQTPWLGVERALSVVPAVSALRSLRRLGRPERTSDIPFFGVGDPIFGDDDALANLPALPNTRREINALAQSFGVGADAVLLGDEATEANLRARADEGVLGAARVIAFATHGLLAGDSARDEPALALTPPVNPDGTDDDGLLTASEAASLSLSAEWVILSACDTAAGGSPNAEGLTGLARAFFYAGADALLVSHWPVRDDAAARITTAAIAEARANPDITRAEALRRSMAALMRDPSWDGRGGSFAHPLAWAPFALIGVEA